MQVSVAEPFLPLFDPNDPHFNSRYICLYGGRGSGKSHAVARALILRGLLSPERILCTRQHQNSISDSVLKLLEDIIVEYGLTDFYEVQNNAVYGKNGTSFLFKGLYNNYNSIRSVEKVSICWVEEAQSVSEKSYEVLIPTIRAPGSQIILTFNPDQPSDPTYRRFVTTPPPNSYICKINYSDNPFFPDTLRAEMEHLRRVDSDAYFHVWEGQCRISSDAQVLHGKWEIGEIDVPTDAPVLGGIDFGFAQDPSTIVKCRIIGDGPRTQGTLYIERDFGKVGLEISDTAEAFRRAIPGIEAYVLRADCARPETISHIAKDGLKAVPAEKWSGSVEDGIAYLRGFERIIIHPSCKGTIQEARLYSYKTDRLTGDILPDIIDKHNHYIDAIRYALAPLIKRSGPYSGFFQFLENQASEQHNAS